MTRRGGSGSGGSSGSGDPGAAHERWALLAPPREAPARSGTRPPCGRRAGLRRVAAAAAAAMSPGKPGAGGAGTRRTGWRRRRRRRRRLEAATRTPGLGRSAGPESRVAGAFQGARGMKPAAREVREARPPPRPPGLRWALPPLLLLSLLGKILCTEPNPVSGLRYDYLNLTEVELSWKTDNSTATCWMILEATENNKTLVNDSTLKPGVQYHVNLSLQLNETSINDLTAINIEATPGPHFGHQNVTLGTEHPLNDSIKVQLVGLKPDTQYNVTVYSQAADGKKGEAQVLGFRTDSANVFDVRVVAISPTNMTLTWNISGNTSYFVYTYEIHVAGGTSQNLSVTVNKTVAVIAPLQSSALYNVTIYPFLVNSSAGTPGFLQLYTPPGPVSDFRVMSVSTREIGLAWNSSDSNLFRIVTTETGTGRYQVNTTDHQSIVIDGLYPGTKYHFEIFPQGPNGTEGDSKTVDSVTDPSAVSDLRVVSFTTTEMQLQWNSSDGASDYTYQLVIQRNHASQYRNTSDNEITLTDLVPGTLYNITIYPELNNVQGHANSTEHYTRPNDVSDIEVITTTTAAILTWQNLDEAAPTYTYCLLVKMDDNFTEVREVVTDIGVNFTTLTDLIPGSSYTVIISTQVGNAIKSLAPATQSFCTDPAPVAPVHCEVVPQQPTLVLKWVCPEGSNSGFKLEVSRGAWANTSDLESCSPDNGTEYRTEVMHLNFFTFYNISVATVSCNKTAPPTHNACLTGIAAPPSPAGSPNITSVSHNSVKVKFDGFEGSHGPIKAYAVVVTTGRAATPSADVLRFTYEDFKNGASDTYVTYLILTEESLRAQDLSEGRKYEINVGNKSTTLGYHNGELEPLGSYRACVAGFTNITFTSPYNKLINGAESYVSFGPCSEAVVLPQDPGVICGAVFGCILGALVIVAVGGFIFWRKKRKDAKNNEVSFTQIKPKKSKLIRVENFEAYFKKQQADSNCGFAEEYEDLKPVGISQPKYAAELAENRGKNRYNNVLPYDISRVKLSVQTQPTDDYINANYMPGYHSKKDFIATQGPLPNTLKDFWRMVWEKNVYAIVMLTKCVEQGRTKCEEYWPSKKAQDYGDITVSNTAEIILPEWTIRDFMVTNSQTSETHPLRQFHFTSWPDHGVPDTTDLLINFRYLVRDYMKQSPPESPALVHCSAGVGRTGTFIAIDRLIYQMENENTVDVYGIVYDLRMHRPLMVQTEDQYVFLNQCVLDIIRSQKDSKADLIYQNTTAMTIYENLTPVTAFGKTNGYIA
ncbi:receptor-type tyrosine-protein phosphatase eta [Erinaceus europaeus]|uniref:protein-tyrosine-phosphatase n=1 Tax=Erinaceus europaeus TaxID=9365 RepID=A0ABM3W738_ERIEU|nr:receptor-type tyrosine-protein phosphatase eta [Erinaceus europaeus]